MRESVNCPDLPPAIGPYSHAVRVGNTLYVSGQIPIDPATDELVTRTVASQTERILQNLSRLLEFAGSSLRNVVKTTVFLSDMTYFGEMNEVYARYFPQHPPARSTVAVCGLPKGVDVEIDCIAVIAE